MADEMAFTSPAGVRHVFEFEEVERSQAARGTAFEFPGVDGGYVQRTGKGPRSFPIRAILSGADHLTRAEALYEALLESGIGRLEHPLYGASDVASLGNVSQRNDEVNGIGQTIVECTLVRTIGSVYPANEATAATVLPLQVAATNAKAAEMFEKRADVKTALAKANLKSTSLDILGTVRGGLKTVSSTTSTGLSGYSAAEGSIVAGMDTLVGQPLLLASSIIDLTQIPSSSLTRLAGKLESYANTIGKLIARTSALFSFGGGSLENEKVRAKNDFGLTDAVVIGLVSGTASACAGEDFGTRGEAIAAAGTILDIMDDVTTWRDSRAGEVGVIDDGEAIGELQQLVAATAGYLIQQSFELLQERTLTLTRPRTILDLCAELYGEVDSKLDQFIATNDLSGDELLEIPAGRTVIYYQ